MAVCGRGVLALKLALVDHFGAVQNRLNTCQQSMDSRPYLWLPTIGRVQGKAGSSREV